MVAAGLLVLSTLLPLALGRPTVQSDIHVLHRRAEVPQGFTWRAKANEEAVLNLRIALVQNNATGLETALYDVSNPNSENYGHYLTKTEVEKMVAPKPESLEKVTAWLKNNGLTPQPLTSAGDWLSVQVPVSKANALLKAEYNEYAYDATNKTELRTLAYSIPASLKEDLAFIYPTTQFIEPAQRSAPSFQAMDLPRTTKRRLNRSKRAEVSAACDNQITPECILGLYNIPTTPASAEGNSLGVATFLNEIANQDDLSRFLEVLRPDFPNGTFATVSVDQGLTDTKLPGTIEASLDMQYTVGIATNVPTTAFSVGDANQDGGLGGFLDVINFLLEEENPPLVLTTSFGFNELGFVNEPELASALCTAYGQLGARGVSILFASGDGGVSGAQASNACNGREFVPTFPSGCPLLTSVGSTVGIEESAAAFSSGGFSNIFARPSYQDEAVAAYLEKLGNTNAGLFNVQGRAFPDVSAQGVNFLVNIGGTGQAVSGTSASSPVFASVIALLNDELLKAGKPPMGFLNPLLYSKGAAALNDITAGSNPGCGTDGFPALEGWDPVTGLGTPDFTKLLALVTGSAKDADNNATDGAAAGGDGANKSTAVASATESATASATESASVTATDSRAAATETATESVDTVSASETTTATATESTAEETATVTATTSDAKATQTAAADDGKGGKGGGIKGILNSSGTLRDILEILLGALLGENGDGLGAILGGGAGDAGGAGGKLADILNDPAVRELLEGLLGGRN